LKAKITQLYLCSWPEIGEHLAKSKAMLIPIGSTEQRGPTGASGGV
jgi:creatinine amidohydrolase